MAVIIEDREDTFDMVLIFNNVVPLRLYKGHHKYKKHREVVFLFMIFAGGEPRVRTEGFGICVANANLPQRKYQG